MHKTWKDQVGTVHEGKIVATKNNYDAIECDLCGYIHIIPLPTEQELVDYYSNVFYSDFKPDYIAKHKQDLVWWNHIYERRHRMFMEHGSFSDGYSPRILDIGSGPGFFLKYFSDLGWQTTGVEPSKDAAEFSRNMGLDIRQESIFNLDVSKLRKFDVVHSNQTFEHLVDPKEAIRKLKSLLKPGGLIFLSVANDFNPIQSILTQKMKYDDWWFIPPEHINYFSIQALSTLLKKNGLDEISNTTSFPIDIFLLMGDNYIKNTNIGKDCHNRRKAFEMNLFKNSEGEFRDNFYNALSSIGLGREIEILARGK
jgi:SAM-dependent methyltransferase